MICIVGAGNMGRRYQAICKHEGIRCVAVDKGDDIPESDRYIIATPTDTHASVLCEVATTAPKPALILVEKPIDKDFDKGLRAVEAAEALGHKVYMVNNYAYYSDGIIEGIGDTHYDFYNSGTDGIGGDCIQLIHLAKNGISYLRNENPIWDCMINGTQLNRELIDLCYVKMIVDFNYDGHIYGRLWGRQDIEEAHDKVMAYQEGLDRSPGKKYVDPVARQVRKKRRR